MIVYFSISRLTGVLDIPQYFDVTNSIDLIVFPFCHKTILSYHYMLFYFLEGVTNVSTDRSCVMLVMAGS